MAIDISKIFTIVTTMLFIGFSITPSFGANVYSDETTENSDTQEFNSQISNPSDDVINQDKKTIDRCQNNKHKENNKHSISTNEFDNFEESFGDIKYSNEMCYNKREASEYFNIFNKTEIFKKSETWLNKYSKCNNSKKCRTIQSCQRGNRMVNDLIILGYVNDSQTKLPIENASLLLDWWDYEYNYFESETYTNKTGFYTFNISAIFGYLLCNAHGHLSERSWFWVEENILWINFSLDPRPPENSIICGIINDSVTGNAIKNAEIELYWWNNIGYYYNFTTSNNSGFYQMNVAAGAIQLDVYADGYFDNYTDYYNISENETLWINVSLYPRPPENSIVCGYIISFLTGDPIKGANLNLRWKDNQGHYYYNYTNSNKSGFYLMNVAAGKIRIYVYAQGYFYEYTDYYNISENETLWVNITLFPRLKETSIVCGYITDSLTEDPIEGAEVELYWQDNQGHSDWNYTYSNKSGFYLINTAVGKIKLYVYADGYFYYYTNYFFIFKNEILWVNISLLPELPNYPPTAPIINGSINGTAGKKYDYTFNATDLDGDYIKYFIDWGDNTTEWTGYNKSGEEIILDHVWKEKGTYTIAAKAIDIHGAESKWGTLKISMPFIDQFLQTNSNQQTLKSINSNSKGKKESYTYNQLQKK